MSFELASPSQSMPQPSDFLILLVDDVASNLKVLQSMLAQTGYRLTFASGGKQALERVRTANPDLLLLDLMMPEFDGLQVAAAMKQHPQWTDIPIIFLTASHELDHLLQAFENGAVDYLTKPFKIPELLARVKTHLELKYLRQQVQRQAHNEALLRHMIEGIHRSLDLTDTLNGAVSDLQRFLDADRVIICRCQAPATSYVVAIATHPDAPAMPIQPDVAQGSAPQPGQDSGPTSDDHANAASNAVSNAESNTASHPTPDIESGSAPDIESNGAPNLASNTKSDAREAIASFSHSSSRLRAGSAVTHRATALPNVAPAPDSALSMPWIADHWGYSIPLQPANPSAMALPAVAAPHPSPFSLRVTQPFVSSPIAVADLGQYFPMPLSHDQVVRVSLPDHPPQSADHAAFLLDWQVKTEVSLPIVLRDELWGLLMVHHCRTSEAWPQGEMEMLVQITQQLAIAIQQAELHQGLQNANQKLAQMVTQLEAANLELDRISNMDGLTQVPNRRYFDRHLQQEWLRMRREQQPLTLILCDIDYFKQYNDTCGHLAGDDALKSVAQALSKNLKRPADLLARYGGEEFAAILPNTTLQGGGEIAEQMRLAVMELGISHTASSIALHILTISLGVASIVPNSNSSVAGLFAAVDRALYMAKAEGRNRLAIAPLSGRDI